MSKVIQTKGLLPGILASALLLIGTLYIFFRLSANGPVATLKLFHVAVQDHDEKLLERVTDMDTDEAATDRLVQIIRSFLSQGAQFKLIESQVQTNHVLMQVTYTAGTQKTPMFFVLDREGRTWRVNAKASLQALQQALGVQ